MPNWNNNNYLAKYQMRVQKTQRKLLLLDPPLFPSIPTGVKNKNNWKYMQLRLSVWSTPVRIYNRVERHILYNINVSELTTWCWWSLKSRWSSSMHNTMAAKINARTHTLHLKIIILAHCFPSANSFLLQPPHSPPHRYSHNCCD